MSRIRDYYDEIGSNPEDEVGKTVDNWFFMFSAWPIVTTLVLYLMVVLYGPSYMKSRPSYNIKPFIRIYNLFLAVFNGHMIYEAFSNPSSLKHAWDYSCHPAQKNPYGLNHNTIMWYYFVSKLLDLLDTVFFIMRKKNSHVTFLHVYHHVIMASGTWIYLKFIKGEHILLMIMINMFVHIIMYSYYFLTTLNDYWPRINEYLWWKKYITKLQMFQFVVVCSWLSGLLFVGCQVPKGMTYFQISNLVVFFLLFVNFYLKAYKKPSRKITSHEKKM